VPNTLLAKSIRHNAVKIRSLAKNRLNITGLAAVLFCWATPFQAFRSAAWTRGAARCRWTVALSKLWRADVIGRDCGHVARNRLPGAFHADVVEHCFERSGSGLASPVAAQEKKVISTPDAPQAIGPYSQAIRAGKTLYLAGQISIDPKTKQLNTGTIEEQTKLVLENLKAVLAADGLTMDHVVSTSVFLKDLNEFAKMNEVYGTYFKNAPPARATVEVARLPRDVKVEISAIAVHP
jgi:2-iminobutanoate/2-iminopropanoate deaminase